MAHAPPTQITSKHDYLFETLLFALFYHSVITDAPDYYQFRASVIDVMDPEMALAPTSH